MPDANRAEPDVPQNRVWRVGAAAFDQARRELRVGGELRSVEAKPLLLLEILLSRAGGVVTKEKLLAAVWKDRTVVEQSLTTAVGKLREAFGDEGRAIIEAVRGVGYRIGLPIEIGDAPELPRLAFTFQPGDAVPNRPHWRLERPLGSGTACDVWLAKHAKTGERRVFKFADTVERKQALRREATLSRILFQALGDRADLVRIIDWSFESHPAFLESPFGGESLPEWAARRSGLAAVPLAERIAIVARIARTVAAAHDVGVLHRDIKPSNVLVSGAAADIVVRLVDFGSGRLTEAARLEAVTVTGLGLTAAAAHGGERLSGTLRYMAPEVVRGGPPTIAADVYALGVLLYQMMVGDLDRVLGAGWEADVADPLLRADIREAASSDVSRRLQSAPALVQRLEGLDARRGEQERLRLREQEATRLARQVERARERLPWVAVSIASLVLGLALSVGFGLRASEERNVAQREAATASAVNQFLTEDLIGRGNPINSGKPDESLMEAAVAAELRIGARFARQPMIAGSLYLALAAAFEGRNAYDAARGAFDNAALTFLRTGGANSADYVITLLSRAYLESMPKTASATKKAVELLAAEASHIAGLGKRTPEAIVWLLMTRYQLDYDDDDAGIPLREITAAANLADSMPMRFDEQFRIELRLSQATSLHVSGKLDEADALLARLQEELMLSSGESYPDTLAVRLEQARVLLARHRYREAAAALDKLYPSLEAVFGPNNSKTMMTRFIRAQARMMLGDYDAAIQDELSLHKSAAEQDGENSYYAESALIDLSMDNCRKGDGSAGLAIGRRIYEAIRAVSGDQSSRAQFVLANVAFCQTVLKDFTGAQATIDKIDVQRTAQDDVSPEEFIASISLMKAEAAVAAGKLSDAATLLRLPRKVLSKPDADPYLSRWTIRLTKALSLSQTYPQ